MLALSLGLFELQNCGKRRENTGQKQRAHALPKSNLVHSDTLDTKMEKYSIRLQYTMGHFLR